MAIPSPCLEEKCVEVAWKYGRCERHQKQAFIGTNRSERLPKDWQTRRRIVLNRNQGICVATDCQEDATDVDHIRRGDDHSLTNLQGLCASHHATKTAYEGQIAKGYRGQLPQWLSDMWILEGGEGSPHPDRTAPLRSGNRPF